MDYWLIEMGNDGCDGRVLGIAPTFGEALRSIAGVIGAEVFDRIPPRCDEHGHPDLWSFMLEGRTRWIRVRPVPHIHHVSALIGCTPCRYYDATQA